MGIETPEKTMSSKKTRVCVIGAGPSGISFLYHVNKMKNAHANGTKTDDNFGIDVKCYEKDSTFGGFWKIENQTGRLVFYYRYNCTVPWLYIHLQTYLCKYSNHVL